jgi:hypothetical protein
LVIGKGEKHTAKTNFLFPKRSVLKRSVPKRSVLKPKAFQKPETKNLKPETKNPKP